MIMNEPLVTAVITTYKRKKEVIGRAVKSVADQTYANLELIIVNDNREDEEGKGYSAMLTDAAAPFFERDKDALRIVKTEDGKHGAQAARNTGIHLAKGEYIAFLDDDDEWLPAKIKKQVEFMKLHPDTGMCFCRGWRINEAYDPPYINDFQGDAFCTEVSYKRLLRGDNIGTTSQALIPKTTFEKVGEFDEKLPARQDYEMWIRIAKSLPVRGLDEHLFNYYKNGVGEQITKSWDKCIKGHTLLYQKYKTDIDADRQAKFNVIFYLAHYYMCKGDKKAMVRYYVNSFFISPICFWKMGVLKLQSIKKDRELKKNG